MFNPQLFIQSLFEDTTESTLVFDLIEKVSFMLPSISSSLISLLPDTLSEHYTDFEQSCILNPILISASLDQNLFHISFELPCELDVYKNNYLAGSLHITFKAEATFILRSEHGVGTLTPQSPPKPYESYSPHRLLITHLSFDPKEVHFMPRPPQKTWWRFWN